MTAERSAARIMKTPGRRRSPLNSLQRCLLQAYLECAFWQVINSRAGDGEFLSELVELEKDVESGRFP